MCYHYCFGDILAIGSIGLRLHVFSVNKTHSVYGSHSLLLVSWYGTTVVARAR